jgi:hypothetical protein
MHKRSKKSKGSKTNKTKKHPVYGHNHSKTLYKKIASKAKTMLKKRGYGPNLK